MSTKLRKYKKHDSYPFFVQGVELVPAQTSMGKERLTLVKNTGELVTLREINSEAEKMIDQQQFLKVYSKGVELLPKLGKRGIAVLCYVLYKLAPGHITVMVDYNEAVERFPNLKGDGFYVGIKELLDYGVIAQKSGKMPIYFININYFFNGDRRRVMPKKKENNSK